MRESGRIRVTIRRFNRNHSICVDKLPCDFRGDEVLCQDVL